MNQPIVKFSRFPVWSVIIVALLFVVAHSTATNVYANGSFPSNQAEDCEGSNLEFCLRWGKEDAPSVLIPVSGGPGLTQDCEGSNLEFCLHGGYDFAQAPLIPVSGGLSPIQDAEKMDLAAYMLQLEMEDFGISYWLIVGPAGDEPIHIEP